MSQTSPLYNLTPNVKTQITVTAQANRIRVVNDSSLYLRVYFGADAPILATDPGWHDTISPGDKPLLWITGGTGQTWWAQSGNASSTPFTGVITFLPFFPVGAILPSGLISGASILYITAFSPDETADRGGQTEAFVQGSKQGRFQSVLGAMVGHLGQPVYTDETTLDSTVLTGPMYSITTLKAPNLLTANAAGQSAVNMYVWDYICTMRARTPAVARLNAWVEGVITSNAFVVKASSSLIPLVLTANNFGADRFLFLPSFPMLIGFVLAQGALVSGDLVGFRYRFDASAGHAPLGSFELAHVFSFSVDVINQSPLYALSTPNAAAATGFPWNATYNPQTY